MISGSNEQLQQQLEYTLYTLSYAPRIHTSTTLYKMLIFFSTKDTRILLFLMELYSQNGYFRNYLLRNSIALRYSNKEKNSSLVWKCIEFFIGMYLFLDCYLIIFLARKIVYFNDKYTFMHTNKRENIFIWYTIFIHVSWKKISSLVVYIKQYNKNNIIQSGYY